MTSLKIELSSEQSAFEPGAELVGRASWTLDKPPHTVELRLFWFTSGRGDEDIGLVETVKFEHPLADELRSFSFRLPVSPQSFSGQLISLHWALELVALPSKEVARREFTMASGGKVIHLEALANAKTT